MTIKTSFTSLQIDALAEGYSHVCFKVNDKRTIIMVTSMTKIKLHKTKFLK